MGRRALVIAPPPIEGLGLLSAQKNLNRPQSLAVKSSLSIIAAIQAAYGGSAGDSADVIINRISRHHSALTSDEFRDLLASKGWTVHDLVSRWGRSIRRIHQIATNESRSPYYQDALRGLPSRKRRRPDVPLDLLSREETDALIASKGWTAETLGLRWELSMRRVHQIFADPERGMHFDDALRGLPDRVPTKKSLLMR